MERRADEHAKTWNGCVHGTRELRRRSARGPFQRSVPRHAHSRTRAHDLSHALASPSITSAARSLMVLPHAAVATTWWRAGGAAHCTVCAYGARSAQMWTAPKRDLARGRGRCRAPHSTAQFHYFDIPPFPTRDHLRRPSHIGSGVSASQWTHRREERRPKEAHEPFVYCRWLETDPARRPYYPSSI
eukprot:IDg16673t1